MTIAIRHHFQAACIQTCMRILNLGTNVSSNCFNMHLIHQFAEVYSANDVFLAISPKFASSKVSFHMVLKTTQQFSNNESYSYQIEKNLANEQHFT